MIPEREAQSIYALARSLVAQRGSVVRIHNAVTIAIDGNTLGAVAGLVGIECGVVSGVNNLESSGVEASDWRPRHDEPYHEA